MIKKMIIGLLFTVLLGSGCSNHLEKENEDLKKQLAEKEEQLINLEDASKQAINELNKSLNLVRWSYVARLENGIDSFNQLEDVYRIHSNHSIKDYWYGINKDYFKMELLGYEHAQKVDFYTKRLESDEGEILVYSDTSSTDGWFFSHNKISDIITKHNDLIGSPTLEPYFVIYAKVTLDDGNVITTPKLPIYYK